MQKFQNPDVTLDGKTRAWVSPTTLDTLWFNTGTLCNLACVNCYIESSPKNDRLVYITTEEVTTYLDEILENNMGTKEIAFTGGEPFMNPYFLEILKETLKRDFEVLILTNAMKPMQNKKDQFLALKEAYPQKLKVRVSLDHYTEELHAKERGDRAWKPAMEGLKWLSENDFTISIAGRTLWEEGDQNIADGYIDLINKEGFNIDPSSGLVLFPEMDDEKETPEITTECWGILKKEPSSIMCANSRMVVKHKGQERPSVMACTLIPYDEEFDMGTTLKEGFSDIKLNHPHCSRFCVLGGGSCSA